MSVKDPDDRPAFDGEIDDDPDLERPPPVEWLEPRVFPDTTDDIPDDTADDVTEVHVK